MQCKSCKEEVQSKFGHAISTNVCPFCGENIFDVALQTILNDLKILMSETLEKNYINEVSDWLKANYSIQKINNHEMVIPKAEHERLLNNEYHVIRGPGLESIQSSAGPTGPTGPGSVAAPSAEPTIFAKRAGVDKQVGTTSEKFKDVIAHITNAEVEEFEGVDPDYGDVSLGEVDETPLSRKEQLAMVDIFANPQNKQELELERLKKLKAKQAVSGGGGGAFRRG